MWVGQRRQQAGGQQSSQQRSSQHAGGQQLALGMQSAAFVGVEAGSQARIGINSGRKRRIENSCSNRADDEVPPT